MAQYNDEYKRKATNWQQEFTRLIPFYSQDMADALRGNIYVDKVPTGENSTITVPRKNNANDTLLSMMTGIYKTRIDPDAVKAYMGRYEKNIAEKEAKAEKDKRDEDFIINTA